MTINQIEYALAVAEFGSINKAADELYVSQSVVSTSIKNLEDLTGKKLFIRSNQGATLTAFGKEFINYMKPVILQIEHFDRYFIQEREKSSMSISIANNGVYFINDIVLALHEKYKSAGIAIEVFDVTYTEIENTVADGYADIGIVNTVSIHSEVLSHRYESLGLHYMPINNFKIGIGVSDKNPLYHEDRTSVTVEELKDYPLLAIPTVVTSQHLDLVEILGIQMNKNVFYLSSNQRMTDLLAETDGYTIYTNASESRKHQSKYFPGKIRTLLLEDTDVYMTIGIIMKEGKTPTQLESEVLHLISHYLETNEMYSFDA